MAVSMKNLPSASNPSLLSSISSLSVECLLCVGPMPGPSFQGLYSLVRQTDPGQVNCRCHVERELPWGLYEGPDHRLVCVGWDRGWRRWSGKVWDLPVDSTGRVSSDGTSTWKGLGRLRCPVPDSRGRETVTVSPSLCPQHLAQSLTRGDHPTVIFWINKWGQSWSERLTGDKAIEGGSRWREGPWRALQVYLVQDPQLNQKTGWGGV